MIKVPLVSGLIISVVPQDHSLETVIWGLACCQSFKLWLDAVACRLFFLEPWLICSPQFPPLIVSFHRIDFFVPFSCFVFAKCNDLCSYCQCWFSCRIWKCWCSEWVTFYLCLYVDSPDAQRPWTSGVHWCTGICCHLLWLWYHFGAD